MELNKEDPRLMDYVLGELDADEARAIENALQLPQNAEALREVEALRGAVRMAVTAMKKDAQEVPEGLSRTQRENVLAQAAHPVTPMLRRPIWRQARWLAAAAAVVFCAAAVLYSAPRLAERAQIRMAADKAEQAEIAALHERLDRLGYFGMERYLITDLNAPRPTSLISEFDLQDAEDRASLARRLDEIEATPSHGRTVPQTADGPPSPAKASEKQAAAATPQVPSDLADHLDSLGYHLTEGSSPPPEPVPMPIEARRRTEERSLRDVNGLPVGTMSGVALPAQKRKEQTQAFEYLTNESAQTVRDFHTTPTQSQYYPGGERYTEIVERPFTRADEAPLSTFSLHPDTAAYTNVRRFLQQGQRPPKDAVRIEELINYFDYSYPQPDGRHPFSVNIEVGSCPWAPGQLLAKIGVQGRRVDQEERPAANLVFLIDVSGSMSAPNRLPLVKESLKALVDELRPDDRVGIVTYAGNSAIALRSTAVGKGRDSILRAIEMLQAGGSTHGSAGIQDAYAMAQRNFLKEGINRVILATDGDFNVGVQSREGLLALIEEKRQTGVFLTVLGYGMGNLKDGTLELLASKGNGNYAYIDTYREARRVLIEQLSGTLMTIAKDAKIQVEFNPAQVRAYRLIGFENRMLAARDFHDDTKDAGEIGAGHSVTALYQIVPHGVAIEPGVDPLRYQEAETPPKPEPARQGEMMFVKLRYKQPDQDASELLQIPVAAQAASLNETTSDYRFAASVAGFGLLLRDSAYKGETTYDMVRQMAAAALNNDARREEFLDLVVTAKTLAGQ